MVVDAERMSLEATAAEALPESVARLRAALGPDRPGSAPLWPALARLDWAMALPNHAAPGFVYLAGACGGTPVGGGGRDLAEAAGRLAGEASETLAQASPLDPVDLPADPAILAIWGAGPRVPALNLTRGRTVGAPLAAIFPAFPAAPGAPPRSLGLAAGPGLAEARLAATLELVERDAAAAWWAGATRPRAVSAEAAAPAAAALAALRNGAAAPQRPTTFLALPSITGLPVAAALSRDGAGSGGLVVGLKAGLDMRTALLGATMELLQMEIALEIARLRATQARTVPGDAGPLGLAALDLDAFATFRPLPPASPEAPSAAGLDDLVAHLARLGIEVIVVDLDGPPRGPRVTKAFAPGLRPLPGPGAPPRPEAPGALTALM
jgi:ribosomal protein S12 methylthiotransferase accessory factor